MRRRSTYASYRNHAVRSHQDGLALGDRLAAAMLLTAIIGGMYAMVSYSNHRDSKAFCNVSSVPSRPLEQEWEQVPEQPQPRTLDYLDILPPTA